MRSRSMMKWRVRRDSHCSSIEHDDIRRSLEVLDSVLAEFDDCLDSWDTPDLPQCDIYRKLDLTDYNSNDVKFNGAALTEAQFDCLNSTKDGSTSHISSSIVPEQPRVGSPPPIPKRSPATKLSEHNGSLFPFPADDNSTHSLGDSIRTDLSSLNHVPKQRIREVLSSLPENTNCDTRKDKCVNCGRGLKQIAMEQQTTGGDEETSSPFHQRKQMFEAKIAEASTNASLNRSYGSSFKQKRAQLETSSDLSVNLSEESGFGNGSELSRRILSELSNTASPILPTSTEMRDGLASPNGHHAAKCTCKERIRRLDAKFADVRRLLKLNKIKGLNSKPPTFVPPPPPTVSNGHSPHPTNSQLGSFQTFCKGDLPGDINSSRDNLPKTSTHTNSLTDTALQRDDQSLRSTSSSSNSLSIGCRLADSPLLCNRCSTSLSVHLSVEDLPKLLPTDALNRPHLGFSYSLEEDLPPGVKEIQQTSTPKSDVSSPRLFRTKESNLSTFSHSASSLGYISSQSDLELNDLSTLPDKVPVSSFKSRTLPPNGLDRSPFYSAEDDTFDKVYSASEVNDYNDNRLLSSHHKKSVFESQKRSSSTPLPPEPEKTKTKHFRVFSRKVKKDKKKSGGTP